MRLSGQSLALSVRPRLTRNVLGLSSSISTPTSRSLLITVAGVSGRQSLISKSPPVIAAATIKVPVSMRSGMIVCSCAAERFDAVNLDCWRACRREPALPSG